MASLRAPARCPCTVQGQRAGALPLTGAWGLSLPRPRLYQGCVKDYNLSLYRREAAWSALADDFLVISGTTFQRFFPFCVCVDYRYLDRNANFIRFT